MEKFEQKKYSRITSILKMNIANIRILMNEGIIDQVRKTTGPYLQRKWQALEEHPLVGEARGIGFLGALELVESKATRKAYEPSGKAGILCRDAALRNGLIMRAVGDSMIISPPLIMNTKQIDQMMVLVTQSLDDALMALRN